MNIRARLLGWCCWFLPAVVQALGPHEVLLLVNDQSPRSVELANHYAHLRQIPPLNIVQVSLPPSATSPSSFITREEFTRLVWEPAQSAIQERRIGDHILAWAYSADFPVLITGDPPLSIQGLTLARNREPEAELIRRGTHASLLFAGPGQDLKRRGTSGSLEQYAMRLGTNMPLPSMLLAHTGARGETMDQAVRRLEESARRPSAPLPGQVFFLTSDDVRSTCRSWQFEDTVAELKTLGQTAQILPLSDATSASQAWGIMAGTALPEPAQLPRLVPGSMAEHLTSFAAVFNGHTYQTKMTAWLQAGAAASAGTVTEPMSVWTKFPHARFFVHYANGCTLLESFAQAMASPLQAITIGDPLLAPWGKPQGLTLVSLSGQTEDIRGLLEFAASPWGSPAGHVLYLLDGRSVFPSGNPPLLRMNTSQLADGYHELRAVVYAQGAICHQGFSRQGFTTDNRGRGLRILNLSSNQLLQPDTSLAIACEARGEPREIALVHHDQIVERQPVDEKASYTLRPSRLGAGPSLLQLAAIYADGEIVRSRPVPIRVARAGFAPPPGARWQPVPFSTDEQVRETADASAWQIQSTKGWHLVRAASAPAPALALSARLRIPGGHRSLADQWAALAFDAQDEQNFSALIWLGDEGSWSLGRVADGVWTPECSWGSTLAPDQVSGLMLRQNKGGGLTAEVDGLVIGTSTTLDLRPPFAFGAGTQPIEVSDFGVWVAP